MTNPGRVQKLPADERREFSRQGIAVRAARPEVMRRKHTGPNNLLNVKHGALMKIPEVLPVGAPESAKTDIRNIRRRINYRVRKIFNANPHLDRQRDWELVHVIADNQVRVRRISEWMARQGYDELSPEAEAQYAVRQREAFESRVERLSDKLLITPATAKLAADSVPTASVTAKIAAARAQHSGAGGD